MVYQGVGGLGINGYGQERFVKFGKSKGLQYNPTVPLEVIGKHPVYSYGAGGATITNIPDWQPSYSRLKARLSYAYSFPDPYLANVVLHLKGDGVNNSTNIIDSSSNLKTITRFGDTKISTAQSKYGDSSIYFDGNGDYLEIPSLDLNLGGLDFCLETWIYPIAFNSVDGGFLSQGLISGSGSFRLGGGTTGNLSFTFWTTSTSAISMSATNILIFNSWNHCAVTRSSSTFRLFHNGIQVATMTNASANANQGRVTQISYGFSSSAARFQNCYQDNIRITKGIARYTSNFNPETDTYLK